VYEGCPCGMSCAPLGHSDPSLSQRVQNLRYRRRVPLRAAVRSRHMLVVESGRDLAEREAMGPVLDDALHDGVGQATGPAGWTTSGVLLGRSVALPLAGASRSGSGLVRAGDFSPSSGWGATTSPTR